MSEGGDHQARAWRPAAALLNLQLVGLGRLLLRIDHDFDRGRARRAQDRLDRSTYLVRPIAVKTVHATGLGDGHEVDWRERTQLNNEGFKDPWAN